MLSGSFAKNSHSTTSKAPTCSPTVNQYISSSFGQRKAPSNEEEQLNEVPNSNTITNFLHLMTKQQL
jgi:hypothetical protein